MKERVIKVLQSAVSVAVNFICDAAEKHMKDEPISYKLRRELNEVLESLFHLSSNKILKPQEDVLTRKIFGIGEHVIYEKLMHFGNYYYSKQKLIHSDIQGQEDILKKTNVESASMLLRIRSFQLGMNGIGGSTDDYFISRMPQLLDGISFIINHDKTEIYLPVLYNLLNLRQTIYYYFQSNHKIYHPRIDELQSRVISLIRLLLKKTEMRESVKANLSVLLFYEQYRYYNKKLANQSFTPVIDLDIDTSNLLVTHKLRFLNNLTLLNEELFLKHFEEIFLQVESSHATNIVDTALIIRIASFYLSKLIDQPIEITIPIKINHIDLSRYMPQYFNGIDSIQNVTVDKTELSLLYSYDDNTLRSKLSACLLNIPINEIDREMRKPHGGFEISDMELKIKINGNSFYMCMPFKTGKEIKSDSVPVDIFYQILRPFFHFSNCTVVFITAKKCSQNLLNEIKRAQDKYDFGIEVIEHLQLAKLLKINGQLD